MQGFRGNCGFPGKLGMCSSLAEPDSGGIPKSNLHTLAKSEAILPNRTQLFSPEQKNPFETFPHTLTKIHRICIIAEDCTL